MVSASNSPTPSPDNLGREYLLSHEIDFNKALPCQIDYLYARKKQFLRSFSPTQREAYLSYLSAIERDSVNKSLVFGLPSSTPLIKSRKKDRILVERLYHNSIELARVTSQVPSFKDCPSERLDAFTRDSLHEYLNRSEEGVSGFLLAFLSDSSRSGLWKYHHFERELSAIRSIQLQYICKVLCLYLLDTPLLAPDKLVVNAPLADSTIINYRGLQDKLEARLCYCFKVLMDGN